MEKGRESPGRPAGTSRFAVSGGANAASSPNCRLPVCVIGLLAGGFLVGWAD